MPFSLGKNKSLHQYWLGTDQLENSLVEKKSEVQVVIKLTMSQQHPLVEKKKKSQQQSMLQQEEIDQQVKGAVSSIQCWYDQTYFIDRNNLMKLV